MSAGAKIRPRPGGVLGLLAAVAAILVIWLGVLPAVSRHPTVREHIRRNQRLGIDPSAMFYTEVGSVSGVRVRHHEGRPQISRIQIGDGE